MTTRLISCLFGIIAFVFGMTSQASSINFFDYFIWDEVNDGTGVSWEARAGLQAVRIGKTFYILGGRSPKMMPLTFGDSNFYNDVWKSDDYGQSWSKVTDELGAPWAARAYFQALTRRGFMYVLGGQDSTAIQNPDPTCGGSSPPAPCPPFILKSTFFNDVWRSKDGVAWKQMTANAAWSGRAGLSAVVLGKWMYVVGGSVNDDSAIIGPGGPPRIYFNDVYKSTNGKKWVRVTEHAPWAPRAGAVLVTRGNHMYLLGGEDGFVCNPETPRCPPYFNDVWKSSDGKNWTQLTEAADWSPRPGHQCEVLFGTFVCFGGFGLSTDPTDPFKPSNPTDVWVSHDAVHWTQVHGTGAPPWNASGPEDIKYDFAAFPVYRVNGKIQPSIFTFGGDLETFNPFDPLAFLKVSNDVWQFRLPSFYFSSHSDENEDDD